MRIQAKLYKKAQAIVLLSVQIASIYSIPLMSLGNFTYTMLPIEFMSEVSFVVDL